MPQHKSAAKRVRQNRRRRERNRMHRSKMRTLVKKVRMEKNPEIAQQLLNEVKSYIDSLVNKGVIHANKAARYKSRLERRVKSLQG